MNILYQRWAVDCLLGRNMALQFPAGSVIREMVSLEYIFSLRIIVDVPLGQQIIASGDCIAVTCIGAGCTDGVLDPATDQVNIKG